MQVAVCGTSNLDDTAQEKISHGSYGFPVAIYDERLEEEEVPWHWHVELELIVVVGGEGIFSCNGKSEVLREGQGIIINGGNLHSCKVTAKGACHIKSMVVHPRLVSGGHDTIFWEKYLSPLLENQAFDYYCLKKEIKWEAEILNLLEKAWTEIAEEKEGFEFKARENLSQILFLMHQNFERTKGDKSDCDIRKIARTKTMMEFVQDNYREDINLMDIADSAMVSLSECQRCFKNILDITPMRYLIDVRLQKACELLETTNFSVSKVAELCGFLDNSYFGKIFKREMKMTPLQYRKNKK